MPALLALATPHFPLANQSSRPSAHTPDTQLFDFVSSKTFSHRGPSGDVVAPEEATNMSRANIIV
jgi:hypothetical protein